MASAATPGGKSPQPHSGTSRGPCPAVPCRRPWRIIGRSQTILRREDETGTGRRPHRAGFAAGGQDYRPAMSSSVASTRCCSSAKAEPIDVEPAGMAFRRPLEPSRFPAHRYLDVVFGTYQAYTPGVIVEPTTIIDPPLYPATTCPQPDVRTLIPDPARAARRS